MHEPLRAQAHCPDGPQGLIRSRPERDEAASRALAKKSQVKAQVVAASVIMERMYVAARLVARCGMTRDDYNRFCAALPHTTHVVQWGASDVWKVGGQNQAKVFAIGSMEGGQLHVSFKCSRMSFDMLKDAPGFRPAPYLASRGMIWLQRTSAESVDDEGFKRYLCESHRLVSLGLTRKLQRELGLNQG